MRSVELLLLILAYIVLILCVFVGLICYKKNLERWQMIAFVVSLLLLIISITITPLLGIGSKIETTSIFTLLSMVLVGVTTALNIYSERKYNISSFAQYSFLV